jgi:hypothetical protein
VIVKQEIRKSVRICRSSCNTDSLYLRELVFSGGALKLRSSEYSTQYHDFTHTKFARALTFSVFLFENKYSEEKNSPRRISVNAGAGAAGRNSQKYSHSDFTQ